MFVPTIESRVRGSVGHALHMQTSPPPRSPRAGLPSFDEKLENEEDVLDALVSAHAKGQLDPSAWTELHEAAVKHDRVAELAFAYESVSQGRKLRTVPQAVQAEVFYRAATFFGDVLGDEFGASTYLERALAASPAHEQAFARIEGQLTRAGEHQKLAELCLVAAAHQAKAGQTALLVRAAELFGKAGNEDKSVETYQQLLRLEPTNETFRRALAQRYLAGNRHRDLARLLEQSLAGMTEPQSNEARELRAELVDVFANRLQEPERAMPHVEVLLEGDATHAEARRVATRLLDSKGLAARAAAALAPGATTTDERAKLYAIELDNTRGAKRRDVLRRIGVLKQDELGDRPGALAAFEQALGIDPTDDELRRRFVTLGSELRGPLEVVKTFARVASLAKDPVARARMNAEMGELLLRGGDPKRARSVLSSVLATPNVDGQAALTAARAMATVFEGDRDTKHLIEVLVRIGELSPVEAERHKANERVATMAAETGDVERAVAAWRRLVDSPLRARALEALEPFYVEREAWEDLAFVLEERARDAESTDLARELSFRAALVLSTKVKDTTRASNAWRQMVATYGPARDLHAQWMPLLEAERQWADLATALATEAKLAAREERPSVLARLGHVHLTRIRNIDAAVAAFKEALDENPEEKTSRATLEKLLATGEHRLAAATVLESVYRRTGEVNALLKVLDVKATMAPTSEERLSALEEAARLALDGSRDKALDFVARGLREAVEQRQPVDPWLARVDQVSESAPPSRRASMFAKALGDRPVDSPSLLVLAKRVGEAHASAGDVGAALGAFRKALAYEPGSVELIDRVDGLLREHGNPEERVVLYRAALERATDAPQRRHLLHAIGSIERSELSNPDGAILAFNRALKDDPDDTTAFGALVELYAETEAWDELCHILEERLPRASSPDEVRSIRAQLAEVAARHGQRERAAAHARTLLDDPELTFAEFAVVERVAAVLDDADLLRALLERRAEDSTDPKVQLEALSRLASLAEERGHTSEAVSRLGQAAEAALGIGDEQEAVALYERVRVLVPQDTPTTVQLTRLLPKLGAWAKLPPLYDALLDQTSDVPEKVELLLEKARVYGTHLDDPRRAYEAAASAFTLAPSDAKTFAELEGLAGRANAGHAFAELIDGLLDGDAGDLAPLTQGDLRLAKAGVLATAVDTQEAAATAFRELLEQGPSEAAMEGFASLVKRLPMGDLKRENLRWLLRVRVERAAPEDRARALFAAATAEEEELGASEEALALYKQSLEVDPEDVETLAAVSRLSLATGNVAGALDALMARRDASEGDARTAIDVQIASVLATRLGRAPEALEHLAGILEVAPHDPGAIELAASLLRDPTVAGQASRVLERSIDAVEDPEARVEILRRLVAHAEPGSRTRFESYRRLLDMLDQGDATEELFELGLGAAREWPHDGTTWDRVEEIARRLGAPEPIAKLYEEVLQGEVGAEEAIALGRRAVAFHEEWFDDDGRVVGILERVLTLAPADLWAFDRLKLIFDAQERWDDLFALVDRTAANTDLERRVELLEDAAQVAKDFANDGARAIGYLEQLLALKPANARLSAALERLYEKNGCHRELVQLLGTRIETLDLADAQRERARIAELWLRELRDPSSALIVVEDLLAHRSERQDGATPEVEELLERILAAASQTDELRASVPPPAEGVRPSYAPNAVAGGLVRQRAATLLKAFYATAGREKDLARMLEIELEVADNDDDRVRRHREIATIYAGQGDGEATARHLARLVHLEPHVAAHRAELTALTATLGRFEQLVDVLTAATTRTEDPAVEATLLMQAGTLAATELGDEARAIDLFFRILARVEAPDPLSLDASRAVVPLLAHAGRSAERLDVLERLARLEPESAARIEVLSEAARLARTLGEDDRATRAWQACLALDGRNLEALDGLVALFDEGRRYVDLIAVLTARANVATVEASARRADLVRIASLQSGELASPDEAIETWREIEGAFGDSDDGTRALAELYRGRAKWTDLEALLAAASYRASTPEAKLALFCELGDVQRVELDLGGRAIETYGAALAQDPRAEGARRGLGALLKKAEHRAGAVTCLLDAYVRADDWALVLDLTEHRLSVADLPSQVAILREAAVISEERANDPAAAFVLVRRALLLDPSLTATLEELWRLAEATRNHRALVLTLGECVELASDDRKLARALRFRMGEVHETRLDDPDEALAAYAAVVAEEPLEFEAARAVLRTTSQTKRWDAAALALVEATRASGVLSPELVDEATRSAAAAGGFDVLTREVTELVLARTAEGELTATLVRDLETTIAVWHRDFRDDADAAEAAYARALRADPTNAELLEARAFLQRRAPRRDLVETLLQLADVRGGDLALLREAADVALAHVGDDALSLTILEQLRRIAIERWNGADDEATSGPTFGSYIERATRDLVDVHTTAGAYTAVVDLLVATSKLPWPKAESRELRLEAARVAAARLTDVDRSAAIYLDLLAEDVRDAVVASELAQIYTANDRRAELLTLKRRLVDVTDEVGARLGLRLEISALEDGLGDVDAAIVTLRNNLAEAERDGATAKTLAALLARVERFTDLVTLLAEQATLANRDGDASMAADLHARAAEVAETSVHDRELAAAHWRDVIAIEARPVALDALARLSTEAGAHEQAAEYLGRLRESSSGSARALVTLRWADALQACGRADEARERLEQEVRERPASDDVRSRLVEIYREKQDWTALAQAMSEGAAHAPDKAARYARLLEGAELHRTKTGTPDLAVPLLAQAVDLSPQDNGVKLTLADALGHAARYDEARTILRDLVEGFGGRRPKERAQVHYQLAQLDLATGDRGRALVELDAATRIDPANAAILQTLAELARDDGQFDRAERSYRALLTVLRRQDDVAEDASVTRAEIMVELSRIAAHQGQPDRANEILESAFELAAENAFEARRLEAGFRRAEDHANLARALEARLGRLRVADRASSAAIVCAMPDAAAVHEELGRLYEGPLARIDDALDMHLAALDIDPVRADAHDAALRLARQLSKVKRYEERLRALAETPRAPEVEAELLVRLAGLLETEHTDDAKAVALYERAIEQRPRDRNVLDALDRLYERLQNHEGQARVLGLRLELDGKNIDASADALYRLAQLRFHGGDVDGACDAFERAFEVEGDADRAEQLLRDAASAHPTSERIIALYELRTRVEGRERGLIDALARKARLPGRTSEPLREAVELATTIGDEPLARSLLEAWVREGEGDDAGRSWAYARLAAFSESAGDLRAAAELKERAATLAEPDEARRLMFEVAALASGALADLALATTILERLHEREPSDKEAWEPLLDLYRATHEDEKLAALLEQTAAFVDAPADRSRLRFESVRLGMDKLGLSDAEAMGSLREIVEEDGSAIEAAILLGTLLERAGLDEDLVLLLERQLDNAKSRQDAGAIVALSQRLGQLVEPRDGAQAREIYYVALDWDPGARELLLALERLHAEAGETDAHADVMERRLAIETGDAAEALAFRLAEAKRAQADNEAALALLALGFKGAPRSERLRTELETAYRAELEFDKLAELYIVDARAREDRSATVARLREAAEIYRTELANPTKAAEVLREALAATPDDLALLTEVASALQAADRLDEADHVLTTSIEAASAEAPSRGALFELRAVLRARTGRNAEALLDFDAAIAHGRDELKRARVDHLDHMTTGPGAPQDPSDTRALRLRLAAECVGVGDLDRARAVLTELLRIDTRDRDVLRALAQADELDGRWDSASATYRRLVGLEEGEAIVATALKLAEACEKAGRIGDARGGLERARMAAPSDLALREALCALYEKTGALKELAELALEDARAAGEVGPRFDALLRAGQLFLLQAQDPQATSQTAVAQAIAPLEEAHALRPAELDCSALLSDAYVGAGRLDEGRELLERTIASFKGRRARELSALYHRLARISEFGGDRDIAIAYLNTAVDMDSQNGVVASELAYLAMEASNWDVANRALRAVTMLKTPGPLPKALAYQHLGQIAEQQGDPKRALGYYKRALAEDATLEDAKALLDALLAQN